MITFQLLLKENVKNGKEGMNEESTFLAGKSHHGKGYIFAEF